jgi:DNA-binding IclR family transcriptional regulator
VVLDKAEGQGFLRAAPRVGSVVPVHATAVGKLYQAYAPELLQAEPDEPDEPDETDGLGRVRDDTLTHEADLAAVIQRTRSEGIARNRDEWISGLSVWAAPVFRGKHLVGAVAVAGATPRMDELAVRARSDVRTAAGEIAARLAGAAA